MEILKFPDSILFEKCSEVSVFGPELKVILDAMYETMKKSKGIGLAANQVGLKHRMFVMEDIEKNPVYLVNPVIEKTSRYKSSLQEGCLSAPGEFLSLSRPAWVTVSYLNETGIKITKSFTGIWAICVQHEMDHLDGVSFLESKSLSRPVRKKLAKKWNIKQNK